ncbi:MAG: response regulator transcription factor, partial [Solirubrobacterales bacterium]
MAQKLKIMLVDDHYLVRVGLASIIALESDMRVCAEASSGEQAVVQYRAERPDVTLMDLRLPGISGSEAAQVIRAEFPDARIIVLSTYSTDEEIYVALQAGAMAYILKSVQREELVQAIRKAAAGERHIPPDVAARLAARQPRSQL